MVWTLAQSDPSAPFSLRIEAAPRTYAVLFGAVHALASELVAKRSTRVVLATKSRFAFAVGLFGAWEAGLAVELPPNVQPQTLNDLESRAGVCLLHDVPEGPPSILAGILASAGPSQKPLKKLPIDAPLLVLHTSGSSREARCVDKTTAHIENEIAALATVFGRAGYRSFSSVPFLHLYGLLFGLLLPVAHGGVIVDEDALYPSDIVRVLTESDADLFVSTPTHLRALVSSVLPKGRTIVSSGARLDARLHLELAMRHEATVIDVFGSSETGGVATRESPLRRWSALPGVVIKADEETMRVRSPWSGGDVVSEDRIRMDFDGTFEHLGRSAAIVKVGGKRLEIAALERTVLAIDGISDAVAFAEDDTVRGARVYVGYAPSAVSEQEVRRVLSLAFDPVFSPRAFRSADVLPREETGKVSRARLREWFGILPTGKREDAIVETRELAIEARGENSFRVHVPNGYLFFRGHFDGLALLPGVVQLSEIVLPLARKCFPELGRMTHARRLRFRRPLLPDQSVNLRLERTGDGVKFEIRMEESLVSSGSLVLEISAP